MITYLLEYNRYLNFLGIALVLICAFLFSRSKRHISYRLVLSALALTFVIGLITLRTSWGGAGIGAIADVVCKLYGYAEEGARFVFGPLALIQEPWGCVFAFHVLPVIVFFGALMALLFNLRIIHWITAPINAILYPILGTSAAETLNAVANSFLGQTEAPLLIRAYISRLTKSELLTVMVAGMGTISAPLFAVYASFGIPLGYILSAQFMAIPATILISKILWPETEVPVTAKGLPAIDENEKQSIFSALAEGTSTGLAIALAVGAMLVAFVALIACANGVLGWVMSLVQSGVALFGSSAQIPQITLQTILGVLFAPIAWLFGLTGAEMVSAGQLLGTKLVLNEMVGYSGVASLHLSARALAFVSFALCGFANFSSIGIQIAGIGAIAPEQRKALADLGLRAVLGGTLANLLCAFIAGLLL